MCCTADWGVGGVAPPRAAAWPRGRRAGGRRKLAASGTGAGVEPATEAGPAIAGAGAGVGAEASTGAGASRTGAGAVGIGVGAQIGAEAITEAGAMGTGPKQLPKPGPGSGSGFEPKPGRQIPAPRKYRSRGKYRRRASTGGA